MMSGHKELLIPDVQWHIIPCIDPDGAKLNEGWTQEAFSHTNFMKHFHKQLSTDQADFSFPLEYKTLNFNRPTVEARALSSVLNKVKPHFYFSLHNAYSSGCYFFINRDIGDVYYRQFYKLLDEESVHLNGENINTQLSANQYSQGVLTVADTKDAYDLMESKGIDINRYKDSGNSSFGYCREKYPSMLMFVSEPAYVNPPQTTQSNDSDYDLRQLILRMDAENKFVKTVVIEEWEKVKYELNTRSPFYNKIEKYVSIGKQYLTECVPELCTAQYKDLLYSDSFSGVASESQKNTVLMGAFWVLCHNYEFVRLLKTSEQSRAIIESTDRMEVFFDKQLKNIDDLIDFSSFEVIDVNVLAKIQFGSGLIALNSILEGEKR